jgi:tetratricopeptide (TPR) repeat protein
MTENQPRNADEQIKLGVFYLERNNLKAAIEHLRLALEINHDDKAVWASLGAAYHKIGRRDYAEESWAKVLAGGEVSSGLICFQILDKYGLSAEAREKLPLIIIEFLQNNDAENSEDFQNLIRAIAKSFNSDAEKAAYFLRILSNRPTDTSLAAMLVGENIIAENEQPKFYELLINRSFKTSGEDYNFTSVARKVWVYDDAESIYEQENDYATEEPENERFQWQKKYLELLVRQRENSKAEQLIAEIEKELNARYARPEWLRLADFRLNIRGGKFDEREAERFIGITISDSVSEIKPPNVERFNDVMQILKEEKLEREAIQISESYFVRMLALEQFGAANFIGLARSLFLKGETEKALRVLQLMIDAGDITKKETAFGEIAALDVVKARNADAAKLPEAGSEIVSIQTNTFQIAAEISAEFGQTDAAIAFRRQIAEGNPTDAVNKLELAKLFMQTGEKPGAANLLSEIINERNALRSIRWQARILLREINETAEIPNTGFDVFSQFYQGAISKQNGLTSAATEFFINSLVADKDAEIPVHQELIKLYALSGKHFAALKIAETDKSAKSDELLETLSVAAEKVGDYAKAIEFEKAKSNGANTERMSFLEKLADEASRKVTDFMVDTENTRKL